MKKNTKKYHVNGKHLHAVVVRLRRLPDDYVKTEKGYDGIYYDLTDDEKEKISFYI